MLLIGRTTISYTRQNIGQLHVNCYQYILMSCHGLPHLITCTESKGPYEV